MKKSKNIIIILAFVLTLGVISGSMLLREEFVFTSAKVSPVKTVILDAGHGGLTNTIH